MNKVCVNCETKLRPVKGGYTCPKCHSLYSIGMEMIWDATHKHKRKEDGNKEV
jgi:Zn finger protein HypA/HybF involved in hydrogenase expression